MPYSDWLSMCSMSFTVVSESLERRDDPLLHVVGRMPAYWNDRDHRDVDVGEDVGRRPQIVTTPRISTSIARPRTCTGGEGRGERST
jgi:hypothetical protein